MLRYGLTRRKLQTIAYQRDEYVRSEYIRFMSDVAPNMLLFLDETAADNRTHQRSHGYFPHGTTRPCVRGNYARRKKVSLLAGLDMNGACGAFIVNGAFNSNLFMLALEVDILPRLGRYIFHEDRSVVVMDNCSIHSAQAVQLIRERGAIVAFLPSYSPDLNPIEMMFNQVKQWLRAHRDEYDCHQKLAILSALASVTSTNAQRYFQTCGYL